MDILLQALVIIALIVPVLIGFLLGSGRGLRRSIIRLVLVALSIVLAFVLKGTLTDRIMNAEINGQSVSEYITEQVSQMIPGVTIPADIVVNIVSLIVVAFAFLLSLHLFLFVTWAIIFPICKLFLKNRKPVSASSDGKKRKRKKHNGMSRLLGSILGLAQGVAVAVVCVTVLNGLFFNISNIMSTANDMGSNDAEPVAMAEYDSGMEGIAGMEDAEKFFQSLVDYKDSGIRKFINKMGGDKLFDMIVSAEKEEGKKVTLTGQVNALTGLFKMGKELSALNNMEMAGGLSGSTAEQLTAIFNKLDEINSELSDESKEAIDDLVKAVADTMFADMDLDLSKIDFTTVNFANEGKVISDLSSYKETDMSNLSDEEAQQTAKNIVETVMQSDILLPLLSANSEFTIGLEGENYEQAKSFIIELEQNPESDKDKVEMLKSFFGITDEQPIQPTHTCNHVCEECGKCTDEACLDEVCADKCQGHEEEIKQPDAPEAE